MSGQDRDRSRKKSLGCSIIDDLSWGIDNPPISEIPNKQTGGALPISTKKCIDWVFALRVFITHIRHK